MNSSRPTALKSFMDDEVASRPRGSGGEYVHELIRADRERQRVRLLVLVGAASPPAGGADDAWFRAPRQRAGEQTGD